LSKAKPAAQGRRTENENFTSFVKGVDDFLFCAVKVKRCYLIATVGTFVETCVTAIFDIVSKIPTLQKKQNCRKGSMNSRYGN
jgi:hypothetical protein